MYNTAYRLYLLAAIVAPLIKGSKKGRASLLRSLDVLATGSLLVYALKAITNEKRPDSSQDNSFPSSHTLESFAVATTTGAFARREAPVWYAGAALIGLSRIARDRHYTWDVLVGAISGYLLGRWELQSPRGLLLRLILRRQSSS